MKRNIRWTLALISSLMVMAIGALITGCATETPRTQGAAPALEGIPKVSGAQLWAQNCGHCHNIRSPSSYGDAQWEVVMLHMRVRANLTAEEHRQILAFLKSAH